MSDVKRVVAGTGDYGFEDTVAREKVNELVDTVNTATADISDLKSQITLNYMYVEGDTLFIRTNLADANEVSY